MSVNVNDIILSVVKVKKKLDETYKDTIVKTVLAIDQAVVMATPVDTGRARANWIPTIGIPSKAQEVNNFDKTGSSTIERAGSVANQSRVGDTIYISNNLPYIGALNDGHSKQAGREFVQRAIQAARSSVE